MENTTPKKWHEGYKTYAGIIGMLIPFILSVFGYDVAGAFPIEWARFSEELFLLLGAGLALYGRWKAKPKELIKKRG